MEFELEPPPPSQVSSGARPTRGIDVLGVRLPVQDVGAELLDGVTTVTQTVRYLGLRAWIARRYALARLPNAWGPFSDFAGRVEAAVAIGNLLVDPGTPGLIGSDSGPTPLPPAVRRRSTSRSSSLRPQQQSTPGRRSSSCSRTPTGGDSWA